MSYSYVNPHFYRVRSDEKALLFRGSWTPFNWVEKYNYAFSGPYHKADVALTFDDGPDSTFTPAILDVLKKYGVKATFFLLGRNIKKYPELVERIAKEGHAIGNHTYSHPKLLDVSDEVYHEEIMRTDELIQRLVGYKPRFFRPTYGAINENQVKWATEQDMMVIQWSIDTLDWKGLNGEEITKTVTSSAFPGSIVLQHNADGVPLQGTVEALDLFIPQLQNKGVNFVTLPEMFGLSVER